MFKRLPTALLQLRYQKVRLLVALAGVVFAVVIVFVQLGIRDALFDSAVRLHQGLAGDYFLLGPRSNSLIALERFSERRLTQARAFPEVEFVAPLYLDFCQWRNPETKTDWRNIFAIGVDLRYPILEYPGVAEQTDVLALPDVVLFDRASRPEFGPVVEWLAETGAVTTEVSNGGTSRRIDAIGTFQLGTSFGADGNLVMSHQNFLRIFRNRPLGQIDIGLIRLRPDVDGPRFQAALREYLPDDVLVMSKAELIAFEKNYWQSSTAIGFVFNLGVFLGILVGIVVVYQILYTNVSEHLPQYATLKAIGYRQRYLLSLVLQQSVAIAVLGFIPGFAISMIQYQFARQSTLLPIAMTPERATFVFAMTVGMCFVAGATAVGKLRAADPADIF